MPTAIDDIEIQSIQTAVAIAKAIKPCSYVGNGDRVRIVGGPLQGVEGFCVRMRGETRLVLSVALLQRSVTVDVERDWVLPLLHGAREKQMTSARTSGRLTSQH